jgi:hypothetical protein
MAAREREQRRKASQRAEHLEERRSRRRGRRRIKRYLLGGVAGLAGLIIVLSLVLPTSGGRQSSVLGGETSSAEKGIQVDIQDGEEIEVGQNHPAYNTTPPTSGWHYDIPLEEITWGAQEEPVEDEAQVSYLERGGIIVQYNCPDGCPSLEERLELVVDRYSEGVVLAPNTDMDAIIALTAWGWIDTFEDFDDSRIDDFIQVHIGKGPDSFR